MNHFYVDLIEKIILAKKKIYILQYYIARISVSRTIE
jgi:hypothetical protein